MRILNLSLNDESTGPIEYGRKLVGGDLLPVISHLDPLAMKLIVHSHQTENTPFHQIHRCFPAALKKLRSGPFAVLISGANQLIQRLQ